MHGREHGVMGEERGVGVGGEESGVGVGVGGGEDGGGAGGGEGRMAGVLMEERERRGARALVESPGGGWRL